MVYQLDYCLDLTDSESIELLPKFYDLLKGDLAKADKKNPENKDIKSDKHHDRILRELDCAVIEYMHQKIDEQIKSDIKEKGYSDYKYFDTARGVFTEGGPIYEGAGIQSKNHIQVCIRNLNCIKGFFIPRKEIKFP